MRHPVSIVLVVVLALSLPVSAVGTTATVGTASVADDPDERTFQFQRPSSSVAGDHYQLEHTSNRLVLHGDGEVGYVTPRLDFALTVASEDESIRTDYQKFAFETELEDIEDDENRSAIASRELERIDQRIDELRDRERSVVAAHAAGEVNEEVVLRTLSKNYHEAQELQDALDQLSDHAGDVVVDERADEPVEASSVVNGYKGELKAYQSPVREQIDVALRGGDQGEEGSEPLISIESADDGLVLSTLTDDEYVREVVRYDNRDRTADEHPADLGNVLDDVKETYPWVSNNEGSVSVAPYHATNLYTVGIGIEPDRGDLFVVLDSGTDRIYSEWLTLSLDSLPTDNEGQLEGDNSTVNLQSTPGNGPMKVTVVDSETNEPIEASISIDDQHIGETEADGERWIVSPADEFDLTIRTESESLNVTVTETD